jgi:two-component system response regulator HydG
LNSRSFKVLVVDDDSAFCDLMKRALNAGGCDVETVLTGAAAEAKFVPPYDLVLLDLKLPDRTGQDVLRHIRKFSPSLPVMIVSGCMTPPDQLDACTYFSDKLSSVDALCQVISAHVEKIKSSRAS